MFCKNCGAEIPDNSKFCNECGTPQLTDMYIAKNVQHTPKKKRKSNANIVIACLLTLMTILIILIGSLLLYPGEIVFVNPSANTSSSADLVDSNLLTVDVTLPASFFDEENPPEDTLTDEQKEMGFISATINADGSLTYKVKKSEWKKIVSDMQADTSQSLNELAAGTDYPSIKKVEYNKDFSKIALFVNKQEYENGFDSFACLGAYFTVAYYQMFNQQDPKCEITVVDINSNKIIDTVIYPDAFNEQ